MESIYKWQPYVDSFVRIASKIEKGPIDELLTVQMGYLYVSTAHVKPALILLVWYLSHPASGSRCINGFIKRHLIFWRDCCPNVFHNIQ